MATTYSPQSDEISRTANILLAPFAAILWLAEHTIARDSRPQS